MTNVDSPWVYGAGGFGDGVGCGEGGGGAPVLMSVRILLNVNTFFCMYVGVYELFG